MKIATLIRPAFVSLFAASCFGISSYANAFSQNCSLGETCPVPGNDGGETHFVVTPATGTDYVCEVKSKDSSLKFFVTSGKHFSLISGGGYYNANPESVIEIKGRFKNSDDQNDEGQIKIARVPLTSEGTVKCSAKK